MSSEFDRLRTAQVRRLREASARRHYAPCVTCGGDGHIGEGGHVTCPVCHGTGYAPAHGDGDGDGDGDGAHSRGS